MRNLVEHSFKSKSIAKNKMLVGLLFLVVLFGHTTTRAECEKLLDTPPRGINCLYCMHLNAPDGAAPITQILIDSCISSPAISFVTDGSFGWNLDLILNSISSLQSGGRRAYLHLYLFNGPAQRRWRARVFKGFAYMDPASFRSKLKRNRAFQNLFQDEVRKILPVIKFAKSLGVTVSLAPGLEDNLDNKGFEVALRLIKEVIPIEDQPIFVRSPCSDCALGNQARFPRGVRREKHTGRSTATVSNGVVSTDGDYFRFRGEGGNFPFLHNWLAMLEETGKKGSMFLLWVSKYQDSPAGVVPVSPDRRSYLAPSKEEGAEIVTFLRGER